jgi:hypothetical protein
MYQFYHIMYHGTAAEQGSQLPFKVSDIGVERYRVLSADAMEIIYASDEEEEKAKIEEVSSPLSELESAPLSPLSELSSLSDNDN